MKDNILINYIVDLYYCRIKDRFKSRTFGRKRDFMYKTKIIHSSEKAHELIGNAISNGQPSMIARLGFTEASLLGAFFLKNNYSIKHEFRRYSHMLYNTAGFFSHDKKRLESDIDKFCEIMIDSCKYVDILGINYALLEEYSVNKFCKGAMLTDFDYLGILQTQKPWGRYLEGKKVLVIHPFKHTIEKQYYRREKIWGENLVEYILPKMDLITYEAIQTIAGNNVDSYFDWFEALDIMERDIRQIDFDVAIIGCGAYGFPLAAEIKKRGKVGIHLGGQTQILFGILGRRYESNPFYRKYINEYWVHPSSEETPNNYKCVENGCYW